MKQRQEDIKEYYFIDVIWSLSDSQQYGFISNHYEQEHEGTNTLMQGKEERFKLHKYPIWELGHQ
jgi:hypothetical protein